MKTDSLRRRLTLRAVILVGVVSLLTTLALGYVANQRITHMHDSALEETGQLLLSLVVTHEDEPGELLVEIPSHTESVIWQAMRADGTLLARSHQAPERPLLDTRTEVGFYSIMFSDQAWRVHVLNHQHSGVTLQIATRLDKQWSSQRNMLAWLLLPTGLATVLLGLSLPWVLRRAMSPLDVFSKTLARRQPGDNNPLPPASVLSELQPIEQALNDLLERLGKLLQRERLFAANAAHELRTPLAGIRAQAQILMLDVTGATRESVQQLMLACDRMTTLVERLLLLARAEAGQLVRQDVDLEDLVRHEIEAARRRYPECVIDVMLDNVHCQGDSTLLAAALANLLDNAALHAQGSPVSVTLNRHSLTVEDRGRGLPDKQRQQRPEPFSRGDTQASGHGLGLALVARVAEAHSATLILERGSWGGLRAVLRIDKIVS